MQQSSTENDSFLKVRDEIHQKLNVIIIIMLISILQEILHFIIHIYLIISTKSFNFLDVVDETSDLYTIYSIIFYSYFIISLALFVFFLVFANDLDNFEDYFPEAINLLRVSKYAIILGSMMEITLLVIYYLEIRIVYDILICLSTIPFLIAFWCLWSFFNKLHNHNQTDKKPDRVLIFSQIYVLILNVIITSINNTVQYNFGYTSKLIFYIVWYSLGLVYSGLFLIGLYKLSTNFKSIKDTSMVHTHSTKIFYKDKTTEITSIFCQRCGKKNKITNDYCISCGEKLDKGD